jgi:hypothetical protein
MNRITYARSIPAVLLLLLVLGGLAPARPTTATGVRGEL